MSHRGQECEDPAFLPRLQRKPRVAGGFYWYCPNLITKNPDIDTKEGLKIVDVGEKDDPTVEVTHANGLDDRQWHVLWADLRKT